MTTKPSQRVDEIILERVRKEAWNVGTTEREALEKRALSDPMYVLPAIIQYLDEVYDSKEKSVGIIHGKDESPGVFCLEHRHVMTNGTCPKCRQQ